MLPEEKAAAFRTYFESLGVADKAKVYLGIQCLIAERKDNVLENMVKSLGFSDAVVSVSTDSNNVNVFINSTELN